MANQEVKNLIIIVLVGSFIVILFVVIFIVFIFASQRRLYKKELEFEKQNGEFQSKMVAKVNETQELERERIAKDIHDEVSILFSFASVKLQEIAKLNKNKNLNSIISDVQMAVSTGTEGLRRSLNLIYPSLLMEFGLINSLEILIKLLNSNRDFISISYPKEALKLPEKYELPFFRIIQELLNNAIKHSKADKIQITFSITNNILMILIEDNGIGFDEKIITKGLGINNIRNRVLVINGTVNFVSERGKGTKCYVSVMV